MTLLFDRSLVRDRLQHRRRDDADIIWHKIASAMQDRLLDIKRDFGTVVDIAPKNFIFTTDFLCRKKVDCVFHLSALAGDGQAMIDEEFFPLKHGSIDVLTSLGSLHWVNDVPGALIQMKRALRPDGVFVAAMIGGETLWELRDVLTHVEAQMYGGVSPRVSPFATLPDMAALMQRAAFALPVVDSEKLTITYPDIFALIRDIRMTGQSNAVAHRHGKKLSRDFWVEADRVYRTRHATKDGRLIATIDVLYMIGWSPDASQPQPLKRGSATHRLADMLKTDEIGLEDFV